MQKLFITVQSAVDFGGSYVWLRQVAEDLPALGWEIVLGLSADARGRERELAAKYRDVAAIEILRAPTGTPLGRSRAIESAIRRVRPAVVIPHLLFDTFPAMAAIKGGGGETRLAYVAHEVSARMLADLAHFRGIVDGAVGVSRVLGRVLREIVGVDAQRVAVIPYGIPDQPASNRAATARGDRGVIRIGYAGRFEDDKRILDVVDFVAALDRSAINYVLELAGRGSREAELRTALAEPIAAGRVRLLGLRDRDALYREVYPSWDVFVLFSPSEGWGIAVAEAMMCAVAPVVSDFRGRSVEQLLRHGETALVFPVGDPQSAARHVASLHEDRAQLGRIAAAARAEIAGRFTRERAAAQFDDLLRRTLALPPMREAPPSRTMRAGRLDDVFGVSAAETLRHLFSRNRQLEAWPYAGETSEAAVRDLDARINAVAFGDRA